MTSSLGGSDGQGAFAHPLLATLKSNAAMQNSYRLDEGYSEDTRSQTGSEMRADTRMGDLTEVQPGPGGLLPEWVTGMSEVERSEFAYMLLRSLRTSSVATIVDRLYPLLHIDPINYLPPELMFEVFAYFDPQTLLRASTLSRTWRTRALDSRLWRRLFGSEGWSVNMPGVKSFEAEQRARRSGKGKAKVRSHEIIPETGVAATDGQRPSPKKRSREQSDQIQDDGGDAIMTSFDSSVSDPRRWPEQHGNVEADEDDSMEGVMSPTSENFSLKETSELNLDSPTTSRTVLKSPGHSQSKSLLIYPPGGTDPHLNWQHLYKQKRRLEENWIAGRYTNFQLPHPLFPYEAHTECVYTIQYTRKHLVSGSRDHTLRIWNLDTQRLMVPPLQGHAASVLCLQFDDRPNQDIVISGGSDCNVILWRFSTGKIMRKLQNAHSESVLNLRFDDRVLVTCSKDKTIKVWTRESILPTNALYPQIGQSNSARFPAYILNIDNLVDSKAAMKPLEEYTLLMTLYGHSAAVNAIQILGNQIVSASGDRQVKVWNAKTGVCLKTIPGHQKGIACVQFDGRRIVSGSSDETVRIFDRQTAAEVACLRGHTNLVRTVQARFGDVPDSTMDDEAEARAVDRKFYAAKIAGELDDGGGDNGEQSNSREKRAERKARNAGSKNPKDIFALGAKLPPGGGGSRWARIVSGSYDETVIIWKRNPDNKWVPAHQLYQWQAVLNAGGQLRFVTSQQHRPGNPPNGGGNNNNAPPNTALVPIGIAPPNGLPGIQQAPQFPQQFHAMQPQSVMGNGAGPGQGPLTPAQAASLFAQQQHIAQQQSNNAAAQSPASGPTSPFASGVSNTPTAAGSSSSQPAQGSSSSSSQQAPSIAISTMPNPHASHSQGMMPPPPIPQLHQSLLPGQAFTPPSVPNQTTANFGLHVQIPQPPHIANTASNSDLLQPQPQPQAANAQAGPMQLAAGTNSRVFKLQFDSRRIICCSQDPTIVGWDFANGDEEIIRASRFFGDD